MFPQEAVRLVQLLLSISSSISDLLFNFTERIFHFTLWLYPSKLFQFLSHATGVLKYLTCVYFVILSTFSLWMKEIEFLNFCLNFSHCAPTNCCGETMSLPLHLSTFSMPVTSWTRNHQISYSLLQFRTKLGPVSLALGLLPQSNSSTAKLILLEKLYLNWLAPLMSHPWSFLYLSLFSKICSRSLIFPAEQTSKRSVFPNIFT